MHFHNALRVCRSTKGFYFAPASLFYILKFMYYDLVSELTTGNRPYCKRGFFFLPSWLPAVDLDHLSTRAPPPGTVPCSVQGISQTIATRAAALVSTQAGQAGCLFSPVWPSWPQRSVVM